MRTLLFALAVALLALAGIAANAARYDDPPAARTFVDRHGEVIGTIDPSWQGVKIWTPLAQIPAAIVAATIRAEDRFFFWHRGINPAAVAKAAAENLARGRVVRGGSTITQQLAKLLIQERAGRLLPRGLAVKGREALLAVGLELIHSKAWILERYLNTAYYGRRAYGIAAASEVRFGKSPGELTPEEIAFLAGLPKAPNRNRAGSFVPPAPVGRHFIEYVASQVAPGDGRRRIETTMDAPLQRRLEGAIRAELEARLAEDPLLTAAAVAIDVRSGELLAMAGSRDYFDATIDGAVNAAVALRQPGSALKPFTYFAAFAKGFAPGSVVPDEPLSFSAADIEEGEAYAPQNFDRRYHGAITIREALANSYNVPAVATLNAIGLSFFHDLLRKFGFTTLTRPPTHYGLAVTLGSGEVTLLELANAYAALARGGAFLPVAVERGTGMATPVAVAPDAPLHAAAITSILSDADARLKAFGLNEAMTIEGHRVAVKTGTSYEHRDNWAVGYSPSVAVGVWVGHADGSPMEAATMTGAISAAPIWHAIMESALRGRAPEGFPFVADPQAPAPPARRLDQASLTGGPRAFLVTSPVANTTYRVHAFLPRPHQRIAAEAQTAAGRELALDWYLDGDHLATTVGAKPRVFLVPEPGKHRLRVESGEGERQEITFRVVDSET